MIVTCNISLDTFCICNMDDGRYILGQNLGNTEVDKQDSVVWSASMYQYGWES